MRTLAVQDVYREHAPPHFHAVYGDFEITVEIDSGFVNGHFPTRARALVIEWCVLHRKELLEELALARAGRPLVRLAPLE